MEVSTITSELSGQELVDKLIELTGIPEPGLQEEVKAILEYSGQQERELSLEQLRAAMLEYLEDLHAHLSEEFSEEGSIQAAQEAEAAVFEEK